MFGSDSGVDAAKCEGIKDSYWELLPDMHQPRSNFNPVIWRSVLYLCGGEINDTIESFNGVSFHLLPIYLPEADMSLSCVYNDMIFVMTPNHKVVVRIQGTGRVEVDVTVKQWEEYFIYQPCGEGGSYL